MPLDPALAKSDVNRAEYGEVVLKGTRMGAQTALWGLTQTMVDDGAARDSLAGVLGLSFLRVKGK